MSWLFSQVLAEAFLADESLDGEPYAPLNVMPTPHKFWWRDKTMDPSNLSRFGLTCRVLTEDLGAELLMSYLAGFHARTSAPLEREPDLMENDLGSGARCSESFAKFDPGTSSWRTPQCSLFEDSTECLETLPRWGSMRNGELYPRKMPSGLLALRQSITNETDAGSSLKMPTPVVIDTGCRFNKSMSPGASVRPILGAMAKYDLWPKKCPTPRTQGMCGGSGSWELLNKFTTPQEAMAMGAGNGGTLNPAWVEWLMGWPLGWTCLDELGSTVMNYWRNANGTKEKTAPRENLRKVWGNNGSAALEERKTGQHIQQKAVLQQQVCGIQAISKNKHNEEESEECNQPESLRSLWWHQEPTCSSHGQRSDEQFGDQPKGSLCKVPQQGTRRDWDTQEVEQENVPGLFCSFPTEKIADCALRESKLPAGMGETCGRTSLDTKHRVDRIRALGNGQVPLCAALAWRILGGGQ